MNGKITDMHNPIFDILIKTHTNNPLPPPPPKALTSHHPTPIDHTQYIYTQGPFNRQFRWFSLVQIVPLQKNTTTTTGNSVYIHNIILKTCKYTC
jgi:hypothetical protein